jgi:hypothetical protein
MVRSRFKVRVGIQGSVCFTKSARASSRFRLGSRASLKFIASFRVRARTSVNVRLGLW